MSETTQADLPASKRIVADDTAFVSGDASVTTQRDKDFKRFVQALETASESLGLFKIL